MPSLCTVSRSIASVSTNYRATSTVDGIGLAPHTGPSTAHNGRKPLCTHAMSHSSANAHRCSAWRFSVVSSVGKRSSDTARNRYVAMTSASYGHTARVHRQHRCVANFSSVRPRRYRHIDPWPRARHHDGGTNMSTATIIDALATGRIEAARDIIFEYLACTEGEAGSSVPRGVADLPPPLQAVLTSLAQRHDGPGALLLAMDGDEVVGCVGLSRSDITAPADGLVQRLYVRASHRRHGLARADERGTRPCAAQRLRPPGAQRDAESHRSHRVLPPARLSADARCPPVALSRGVARLRTKPVGDSGSVTRESPDAGVIF
jgi:hypothetical protein